MKDFVILILIILGALFGISFLTAYILGVMTLLRSQEMVLGSAALIAPLVLFFVYATATTLGIKIK